MRYPFYDAFEMRPEITSCSSYNRVPIEYCVPSLHLPSEDPETFELLQRLFYTLSTLSALVVWTNEYWLVNEDLDRIHQRRLSTKAIPYHSGLKP